MKRRNYLVNGLAAIAVIFMFAQCDGKAENTTAAEAPKGSSARLADMKIAFVEIDTLLTQYNFWNDLTEQMMKKEENVRGTLNQKMRELEKDAQEFERKIQNNAFVSRERAEQEHGRITKKQNDLQALQNRLTKELADENQKNSLIFRDSINSFLKIYNEDKGYSMIFSKTGFDNLLYADEAYNITKEIVDGLNARYNAASNK
ncbi:OmpH family outer membrane protein [Bacteroides sp. 224]|uniref:OmpH family outer membrane protein n=1 Tax=Bacteroides sp. 224 TaxID=2302936 RepID=UPI0013D515F7|nr:OmpH family outer membrane protein [Bacteroides sp. 224]NDV66926.1 OmpH family outer membrane protein [Bacteroides sp. 224]